MYMYVYNKAKYDIINIILSILIKYYTYIIYIYNIYMHIEHIYTYVIPQHRFKLQSILPSAARYLNNYINASNGISKKD